MNLNNITTALKTGITIYQYEQWQNTGSVNLMQKEYHIQLSGSYPEESEAWDKFLEENQWKIYPLLANIMQVFLPTGNYQLFYTKYPQGFISIIAKPHDK